MAVPTVRRLPEEVHRALRLRAAQHGRSSAEEVREILANAVKPDPAALTFAERAACLARLADATRAKLNPNPPDIAQLMGRIDGLLDESITDHENRQQGPPALDLSRIDFEALAKRFKQAKHEYTDLEVLKAAIRAQREKLARPHRTRADLVEKFEALIERYNAGSRSIEALFDELVVFDILTRPAPDRTPEERAEVKKVVHELLDRIKRLLVLGWRQKSSARAQVTLAIEDALDTGLPRA